MICVINEKNVRFDKLFVFHEPGPGNKAKPYQNYVRFKAFWFWISLKTKKLKKEYKDCAITLQKTQKAQFSKIDAEPKSRNTPRCPVSGNQIVRTWQPYPII